MKKWQDTIFFLLEFNIFLINFFSKINLSKKNNYYLFNKLIFRFQMISKKIRKDSFIYTFKYISK